MLTLSRCAFILLVFIAASPCSERSSIVAAARSLHNLGRNTSWPNRPAQQHSSCRSSDALDCAAFPSYNNVESNQPLGAAESHLTTEVGDTGAGGQLESPYIGEIGDEGKSTRYNILRGTTAPPGSPSPIHHAAANSVAMAAQKTFHDPQSQDTESERATIDCPLANHDLLGSDLHIANPLISVLRRKTPENPPLH